MCFRYIVQVPVGNEYVINPRISGMGNRVKSIILVLWVSSGWRNRYESTRFREFNSALRLFNIMYVMYILPVEVSVKGFRGRLKSPPNTMQPELKPSNSLINLLQIVKWDVLGK